MPCAVVTGVAGFCGRHLVARLKEEGGVRIVGVDVAGAPPPGLDDFLIADLSDAKQAERVVRETKPDFLFHLAGVFGGPEADVFRANMLTTVRVLDAIARYRRETKVLTVGSAAEYGPVLETDLPLRESSDCHPTTTYGVSKFAATCVALEYARRGLDLVVTRPFGIVGAGVSEHLLVGALIRRVRDALETGATAIPIGNLDAQRDFVAIEDVADGWWRLARAKVGGEVVNLCSGKAVAVRQIAQWILSRAPRSLRLEVEASLVRTDESAVIFGSWGKAHRLVGFRPATPLEAALESAWNGTVGPRLD